MDAVFASRLQFEGFILDLLRRSLWCGDREVALRPKSFDVLCYLAERHGRLATKDEIIQAVWPDVIATDDSLARCISDVRHTLQDSEQRIIKTVPGRGYVFAAPVVPADRPLPAGADASAGAGTQAGRWKPPAYFAAIALAGLVLLLVTGGALWNMRAPTGLPLPDRPSIAVLPFTNLSGDAGQDYFSDGISQDLSTSLSRFGQLFVIADQSASRYKNRDGDGAQIGRELGVRYLLYGNVRKDAERIRIRTQLVEAGTGRQLWSEQYDADPSRVFAIQDEVTQKIVVTLASHIDKSELEHTLRKPRGSLDAYDYYLRGNAPMKNVLAAGDNRAERIATARAFFEKALASDPRYVPAIDGLAWTYFQAWYQPSPHPVIGREYKQPAVIDRAESLARQAVELDETYAPARATLGWILQFQDNPTAGLAEFERVFTFNPHYVDSRYASLLIHAGRAADGIAYLERIMRVDPFYPPIYPYLMGKGFFFLGRYEEAIERGRSAAVRMPGFRPGIVIRAAAAGYLGRHEEAQAALSDLRKLEPDFTIADALRLVGLYKQEDADRLAEGLRKAGMPEK